jgi:hypothetical protein
MTTNTTAIGPPPLPWPQRPARVAPIFRQIASSALRSSVLIAIAMLLILVLLPVTLGAAWTQVAIPR